MAVGFVQTGSGGTTGTGATSVAATMSPAPVLGNLLIAHVCYRTVTGVTVTATGWTGETAVNDGTTGGHRLLTRIADGTEGTTLTFQLAASVKASVIVAEWSDASATWKSLVAGATQASSAAHTGSAATPVAADFFLFFDHNTVSDAATISSNASATPTTGWTNVSGTASGSGSAATRNRAALSYQSGRTASTTPSITWSAAVTGTKQQALIQTTQFVPLAPTSSAATAITSSGFTANWAAPATDSSHDGATGYLLDVATDSGFTSMVSGYNGLDVNAVLSYAVTGLAGATAYWYRVRGDNTVGAGANSGSQNPTTAAPTPLAATLNDNFDDNSRDTAKWIADTVAPNTAPEAGGQLQIVISATSGAYQPAGYRSVNQYDIRESRIFAQLVTFPANANATAQLMIWMQTAGTDTIYINASSTTLAFWRKVASTDTQTATIAVDTTAHKWVRLREAAGIAYCDSSADGATWVHPDGLSDGATAWKWTWVFTAAQMGNCYLSLRGTAGGSPPASDTAITWDNFNTRPSAPPPRRTVVTWPRTRRL